MRTRNSCKMVSDHVRSAIKSAFLGESLKLSNSTWDSCHLGRSLVSFATESSVAAVYARASGMSDWGSDDQREVFLSLIHFCEPFRVGSATFPPSVSCVQ